MGWPLIVQKQRNMEHGKGCLNIIQAHKQQPSYLHEKNRHLLQFYNFQKESIHIFIRYKTRSMKLDRVNHSNDTSSTSKGNINGFKARTELWITISALGQQGRVHSTQTHEWATQEHSWPILGGQASASLHHLPNNSSSSSSNNNNSNMQTPNQRVSLPFLRPL